MSSDTPIAADVPSPGRRRAVLAGGATAVLLLAGSGYVLLSGSDSAGSTGAAAAPVQHARPHASPAPTTTSPAPFPVPPAFVPAVARQPFKPLYVAGAAASGGTAPGAGASPTTVGGGSQTGAAPSSPAPPPPVVPEPVAPAPAPPAPVVPAPVVPAPVASAPATPVPHKRATPYALRLVKVTSVSPARVTWTVAGRSVTTLNGQRFGLHGELVVLSVTRSSTGALTVWVQAYDSAPVAVRVGQTRSVL